MGLAVPLSCTSIKGSFAKSFNHGHMSKSRICSQCIDDVNYVHHDPVMYASFAGPEPLHIPFFERGYTPLYHKAKHNLLLRCKPLVPINTSQQGDPSGYPKKETSKLYRVPGPSLPQGYTVHLHSDCLCFGLGIRSSAFGGKVSHIATGHT